jgi:predicted small secreted protein
LEWVGESLRANSTFAKQAMQRPCHACVPARPGLKKLQARRERARSLLRLPSGRPHGLGVPDFFRVRTSWRREMLTTPGKAFLSLIGAVFAAALLAGCNTIEGAGKDIESAGEEIQEESEEARD